MNGRFVPINVAKRTVCFRPIADIDLAGTRSHTGDMALVSRIFLSVLCLGATAPSKQAHSNWALWYARYDAIESQTVLRSPVLFIFEHRFVPATKGDRASDVLDSDTGGSFDVYKQGGSYYADQLPLFAPSPRNMSVSGGDFDCEAVRELTGYAVTCRSVYGGGTVKSFYQPKVGITWFEYFCGVPEKVCRYKLADGKALFRPEFINALERRGDIEVGVPLRPKPFIGS